MTLTSFDDSLLDDGKYRTGGIGQWVAGFPKQYKLLIFDGVKGLNQCLPFNQGVRSDHRFSPQKVRKCSNPEANCPARTSVLSCRKFYSMDPGQIFNGVLLCSACYMYRHKYHKHRPQSVIDKQIRRYQDEDGVCYWCFRQFPPSGYDRKLLVPQLDKFLCQVCYNFWKDNDKAMPPIPGVNVAVDHTFACENASCTRTDRSLAFKWFFDTDNVHTTLTCETCHYDILSRSSRSVYAARNSRRSVQNIIANPGNILRHVNRADTIKWVEMASSSTAESISALNSQPPVMSEYRLRTISEMGSKPSIMMSETNGFRNQHCRGIS